MKLIVKRIKQCFKDNQTAPETELSFYRVGRVLGKGAFGKVNLAMHKLASELVAIKSINKKFVHDNEEREKVSLEITIMQKMRHEHVL